ncbi:hypothetical protein [Tunicatimonas pelagia]|uniref:hypothetical protein n=1 Tax=Tunicatimonas pelagia TaxID=931531 RepID=UPI0026656CCB|nr:hypothetical protein [Tunicatimonas pelagia]WKN43377.1 hypothetical protein P0M28_00135 [Tunicatimonas pelagia]
MKTINTLRWIHLIGAALIGTYVYSPWSQLNGFTLLMQLTVIPALTLTGFWMWKPKFFNKKGAKRSSTRPSSSNQISVAIMFLMTTSFFGLSEATAQERQIGGSGGFMVGYKSYNTSAYQYFVREGGPAIGNNLLQIGGEGYLLINRWVLGGGGYYSRGDEAEEGTELYELDGGGGYVHVGYVLYQQDEFLLFPLVAIGADALGISRRVNEDITYEPNRFLEANYFTFTPTIDLGVGADWFPGKKGIKLGLRAGYNLSLSRGNEWRHYGGEITNTDLPNNDLDGFYVRLTVGGGHFKSRN